MEQINISESIKINTLLQLGKDDLLIKASKEAYYVDPKLLVRMTNEQLVNIIQKGCEEAWNVLYEKTKNCIHKVFHDTVHDYYKSTMEEDMYSVLYYGWSKAVLTYDKERATANFIAYASFLMKQQYIMFVRKIKENRIGRSVRYELLENVTSEDPKKMCSTKQKESLIQNILEDSEDNYGKKENLILLKDALTALKEEREDLYDLISLHYIDGIPQTKIAEMHNHGQSYISRKIKQGIKFLQDYMLIKSKGNIEDLKEYALSCYND